MLEFDGDTGLATSLDLKKWHRFFDNTPRLGRPVVAPSVANSSAPTTPSGASTPFLPQPRVLQVSPQNIIHSAHYGYIYCMALLPSPPEDVTERKTERGDERRLATGSGDETVKVRVFSAVCITHPDLILPDMALHPHWPVPGAHLRRQPGWRAVARRA